jgi:hypothetical protein
MPLLLVAKAASNSISERLSSSAGQGLMVLLEVEEEENSSDAPKDWARKEGVPFALAKLPPPSRKHPIMADTDFGGSCCRALAPQVDLDDDIVLQCR